MPDEDGPRARFMLRGDAVGTMGEWHGTIGTTLMVSAGIVVLIGLVRSAVLVFAIVAGLILAGLGWWQLAKAQRVPRELPSDDLLVLATGPDGIRLPGSPEVVPWEYVRAAVVHRGFGRHVMLQVVAPDPAQPPAEPEGEPSEEGGRAWPGSARRPTRTRVGQVGLSPDDYGVGLEELVSALRPYVVIHDPDGPHGGAPSGSDGPAGT